MSTVFIHHEGLTYDIHAMSSENGYCACRDCWSFVMLSTGNDAPTFCDWCIKCECPGGDAPCEAPYDDARDVMDAYREKAKKERLLARDEKV